MRKKWVAVTCVLILISFLISLYFYPRLPDEVASHWNAQGKVNGYTSRFWGAFSMPVLLLGVAILLILIPKIDPLRKNFQSFRTYYEAFAVVLALYLIFVQIFLLLWNTGSHLNPNLIFPVGIGVLFTFIGFLLERVKPNWFIGIRTPWTLSSEQVWIKTHRLGATIFKALGVVIIASILLPSRYLLWAILGGTISASLLLTVYSYVLYERETQATEQHR